ncbi:MAG: pectin esterase [Sphingobacteriales bacterium]|nr:MAG: pectin esterase [Sphingobacteriales bacterium]
MVLAYELRDLPFKVNAVDPGYTATDFNHHSGQASGNGDTINTWTSATTFVFGNDFSAENMGFRNDAGFTSGQAVALRIEGDRAVFRNCSITGFQDVLFLSGAGKRSYFRDCYIEGTTDFIFGAGTAVFRDCTIHSKKNSHITAASTDSTTPYGFVFFDCRLTADTNVHKVSLGRPWRPYSAVTYIRCRMDSHIIPEGWNNWKNPANERTARYAEYGSSGPGASPATRVPWARQLAAREVRTMTVRRIQRGWRPAQDGK